MSETELSMTQKNTYIDRIATIIQETRLVLQDQYLISDDYSRKIVLLLCIYTVINKTKNNNDFEFLSLNDVRAALGGEWTREFFAFQKNIDISNVYKKIENIKQIPQWTDLVIYAFEVFEYNPNTFLKMPIRRGVHIDNEKKKNLGIYYTPADVVKFMVNTCTNAIGQFQSMYNKTFLDCSCGIGVFLSAIINEYYYSPASKNKIVDFLKQSIWGIDKSNIAVESCQIALILNVLPLAEGKEEIGQYWNVFRRNIVCGDSSNLKKVLEDHPFFPQKFTCIIGNPPYVTLENKGNLFIEFVKNIIRYSEDLSCSGLIVPLSICYSQSAPFVELRNNIMSEIGITWSFINFDRSPDSLFGDQVKTRNTILFRKAEKTKGKFQTTGLQRWTNENRHLLFDRTNLIEFTNQRNTVIPKLNSKIECIVYKRLSDKKASLLQDCLSTKNENLVVLNGTAYNWLCAYDHIPPSTDENNSRYIPSSMKFFYFPTEEDKYFFISMISNRISYWYWSVTGDGFHVNVSFLNEISINKNTFDDIVYKKIVKLGKEYCEHLLKYPLKSFNAKKCIVNYDHLKCKDIYSTVEKIIIQHLCLPKEFEGYIDSWYNNQILCGR